MPSTSRNAVLASSTSTVLLWRRAAAARVARTRCSDARMEPTPAEKATAQGVPTDAIVINGFPQADDFFAGIAAKYSRVLTLEDGLIGTPSSGPRGFAALAACPSRPPALPESEADARQGLVRCTIADHICPCHEQIRMRRSFDAEDQYPGLQARDADDVIPSLVATDSCTRPTICS